MIIVQAYTELQAFITELHSSVPFCMMHGEPLHGDMHHSGGGTTQASQVMA